MPAKKTEKKTTTRKTAKPQTKKPTPKKAASKARSAKTKPAAKAKQGEIPWHERWKARKAEQAALIETNPKDAMHVAHDRLDYGIEILTELIDKGTLFHEWKSVDGTLDHSWDEAAQCLCSRFSWLVDKATKYARAGNREFITSVWFAAKQLVETVHDVAFDKEHAAHLESCARSSLFLPSLRTWQNSFTYDFQAIAQTLNLSKDCIAWMGDDAQHKLDTPITRLVAEVVEHIGWEREHIRHGRETHARTKALHARPDYMARLPESDAAYAHRVDAMTEDEYLVEVHYSRRERLHYDSLPPLTKSTADEWWNKAVAQEVEWRFEKIKDSRLYDRLAGAKDYRKRADLKRRAKRALLAVAPPDTQAPPCS
jgi:hypothetical protein